MIVNTALERCVNRYLPTSPTKPLFNAKIIETFHRRNSGCQKGGVGHLNVVWVFKAHFLYTLFLAYLKSLKDLFLPDSLYLNFGYHLKIKLHLFSPVSNKSCFDQLKLKAWSFITFRSQLWRFLLFLLFCPC